MLRNNIITPAAAAHIGRDVIAPAATAYVAGRLAIGATIHIASRLAGDSSELEKGECDELKHGSGEVIR